MFTTLEPRKERTVELTAADHNRAHDLPVELSMGSLLTFREPVSGKLRFTLDVGRLYHDPGDADYFHARLRLFLDALGDDTELFEVGPDHVSYDSEKLMPSQHDDRPPLLQVFGNPAPHSVRSGMFFALEGIGREHRFWGVMERASDFSLPDSASSVNHSVKVDDRNKLRRESLLDLSYRSPFCIAMTAFFTMPSPASVQPWAGVGGLLRLVGVEAIRRIAEHERARVEGLIKEFVKPGGAVMAFQRDAYEALRCGSSPEYSLGDARAGALIGTCGINERIRLFCSPPTRLVHGSDYLRVLGLFRRLMVTEAQTGEDINSSTSL